MNEAVRLTGRGEEEWESFRRHVEWSEHFGLFFLFCSAPVLADLYFRRLDDSFRFRIAPSERLTPANPETAAEEILGWVRRYPKDTAYRPPIWLDLSRDHDPAWNTARDNLLARLNEHRELLRNKLCGPLILILPVDYRLRLREIAPDLWAIRQYSLELNPAEHLDTERRAAVADPAIAKDAIGIESSGDGSTQEDHGLPAVAEWKRLKVKGAKGRDMLIAGESAFEAAYAERRLDTARRIAAEVLRLARTERSRSDTPEAVRDLSVSLNNLGRVAEALGRFEDAETAYRESLDLRRRLRERLGDTPEAVRDLSVSLDNVGRVAVALGRFEDAETAYRESLDLSRRLRERLGDNLQTVRDLAIALANLADALRAQNRPAEARPFDDEALPLWQRLHRAFPENREAGEKTAIIGARLAEIES